MATDAPPRQQNQAASRLYDSACELLMAAEEVRAAAADPGATAAFAATGGCLDATLDALADAIRDMRRAALRETSRGPHGREAPGVLHRELGALEDALRAAAGVCDRARERTGPLLAQLTLR